MSYDDPLKNAAEGMTKGAVEGLLNWSSDFIKDLVSKFRNKELNFILDEETIKIVKEQYNSGELLFYKEYIKDKEILFLLKMGLTLRRLEECEGEDKKRNLREKIFSKYGIKGVHIAQFVENGLLNRYIGILIDNIFSIEKFKEDLTNILENIEKHVLFVKKHDKEGAIIKHVVSIKPHNPMIFIISGISSAAQIIKNCENKLKIVLSDYSLEKISNKEKENLFFKRIIF